ncbi:MAG: hypothetical protein KBS40_00685 [Bacteroidales bacterium]|nr:hypothetical protein [Bacteroidales bacterium]
MTDKDLKNILKSTSQSGVKDDELFVQKVMTQLPDNQIKMRVVWLIRMAFAIIAIIALLTTTDLSRWLAQISMASIEQISLTTWIFSGIVISGLTFFICRNQQVI